MNEKIQFNQKKDNSLNNEEKIKEEIFAKLINERIVEDFEDGLYEVFDGDDEIVESFLAILSDLDLKSLQGVLAIPKSLRFKRLSFLKNEHSKEGRADIRQIINDLRRDSEEKGYQFGYHISPNRILEKEEDWTIDGSEFDDRDDRKMAYYSMDYKNLFKKKKGNYLYVVRAIMGKDSSHKKDTSNNWGRADKLSIISEIPLQKIEEEFREKFSEEKQRAA
jgi:hypothetical protein